VVSTKRPGLAKPLADPLISVLGAVDFACDIFAWLPLAGFAADVAVALVLAGFVVEVAEGTAPPAHATTKMKTTRIATRIAPNLTLGLNGILRLLLLLAMVMGFSTSVIRSTQLTKLQQ
jgi:hypothetical protein